MLASVFATLAFVALSALAAPYQVKPHELLAWSPTITSPTEGQIWEIAKVHQVTWRTDNIPVEKQNSTGLILLGHAGNGSENLDILHPLASDFPISAGSVPVSIRQDTPPRDDYFIVLFGDSGNASPQFSVVPASPSGIANIF